MTDSWDCIIVGGGAAGLSAALVLGRARQRTLLVDAGNQSNLAADGIGGLLGRDGAAPHELYAAGRSELGRYPTVEVRSGVVTAGVRDRGRVVLQLSDGSRLDGKRVLLATGMDYDRPCLPGVDERWGRSVFHCPFCHGWEMRDGRLGVLGSGAIVVQRALLLREWSDTVTVYTDGSADLEPADRQLLDGAGIEIEERPVVELLGPGTALRALRFDDGSQRRCDGLLVPVVLKQRSALAAALGVALAAPGPIAFDHVEVDAAWRTNVPEVYAAGDSATMPSVANAIASGALAAAMIVHDLVAARHGLAHGS